MARMVALYNTGVYLVGGVMVETDPASAMKSMGSCSTCADNFFQSEMMVDKFQDLAKRQTMAYSILSAHNTAKSEDDLQLKFDKLISHDITYVGIIQTARASGLTEFPMPYVLTNCHNSLCAVGGTINEDDHFFGLSAAKKYGGIYVPPNLAVIHQFARERMAACGDMILGSDSHTRYGALGTMAIGEGGPELVKQLLGRTYDVKYPEVIGVYLHGKLQPGVGPQDVALALIGAVFGSGFVNNTVLEFIGPGVSGLSVEERIGIDVMTTETTCLSSIWQTDEKVKEFYEMHGRADAFRQIEPGTVAYYDGLIEIDLSAVRPMIALPFHPSNALPIEDLIGPDLKDLLHDAEELGKKAIGANADYHLLDKYVDGKLLVQQGVIAGCAGGGFENLCAAADILRGKSIGTGEFSLSVYPASQPIMMEIVKNGTAATLMQAGAVIKPAFCGPCFGAGDTPANGALSIRHSTRNFPNREGSKPGNGQLAAVALMDARSIAATAANGGFLTPATAIDADFGKPKYFFDGSIYQNRVYDGVGKAEPDAELKFGPNIKDWPAMTAMTENLLLKVVSEIHDPVTTTDELIPSGETSSYRSNPLGLAEFALSRRDPAYVGEAKKVRALEEAREAEGNAADAAPELADECAKAFAAVNAKFADVSSVNTGIGSTIFAVKPGDGSAREQAASCQKVLGGWANIAGSYATKRYRSNLINWGMLPFVYDGDTDELPFARGEYVFVPGIREAVESGAESVKAYAVDRGMAEFELKLGALTADEREIIAKGCLINYYRS